MGNNFLGGYLIVLVLLILLFFCKRNKRIIKIVALENELRLARKIAMEWWFFPKIAELEKTFSWFKKNSNKFNDKNNLERLGERIAEIHQMDTNKKNVVELSQIIQELEELKRKISCS